MLQRYFSRLSRTSSIRRETLIPDKPPSSIHLGTGKSRMVDQLARKIITVPMCLCPEESDGDTFLLILFGVLIIRFKKGTLLLVDHLFLGFFLGNHGSKGYLVSFMLC